MVFQFHHRKLMADLCEQICHGKNSLSNCSSPKDCTLCFNICLTNPQLPPFYYPPPPPLPKIQSSIFPSDENENQHKITNYFILTLTLLAFTFFVICIRSIYINFRSRRRRLSAISPPPSSSLSSIPIQQIDDDDDDHDAMVDHPIWYIRTLGLHQSVINAISVCKYKKGEGLIEGTECSVCLSEFEENESLRLLPKCHHAFHLPCIDTWLSSHTNCPMCRAPIVNNPIATRVESLESRVVDSHSSSWGDTRIDISDGIIGESETNLGFESSAFDSELMNREENEEGRLEVSENERQVVDVNAVSVRPRRSVSMDDSFVAKYNHALANVLSIESNGNDLGNGNLSGMSLNEHAISKVNGNENLATTSKGSSSSSFRLPRYLQGVPSPMKRSSSYNGKFLLSWYSRSQRKPNAISRRF